jgi:hypothetical protein
MQEFSGKYLRDHCGIGGIRCFSEDISNKKNTVQYTGFNDIIQM